MVPPVLPAQGGAALAGSSGLSRLEKESPASAAEARGFADYAKATASSIRGQVHGVCVGRAQNRVAMRIFSGYERA